jgi:hypothetical protein
MKNSVKYKRIYGFFTEITLQEFFKKLFAEGWNIIDSQKEKLTNEIFLVVVVEKLPQS